MDEQEFDWQAEMARCEACIVDLGGFLDHVVGDDRDVIEEAIALLKEYADELEGNR